MTLDLFAGVAVSDLPRAVRWFDRFLGEVETFEPPDTEQVWTVAESRHVYVQLQPEHAGHSMVTLFLDDYDGFLEAAATGVCPVGPRVRRPAAESVRSGGTGGAETTDRD